MKVKKRYLTIFFFLLLVSVIQSQTHQKDYKNRKYNYNLVKKIYFYSNGNYYPLTIIISPYGYWFTGEIYLGHKASAIIQRSGNIFGWGLSKVKIGNKYYSDMVETSNNYIYDTVPIDTISSVFKNIKCISNIPKLPLTFSAKDNLINITDSNSYELLVREFKYSYLLKNIELPKDSCEIIRFTYPLNVYYPYKISFAVVALKIWPDKIEMISNSLNTVNLLDIKLEKHGGVLLKKKDYKRLKKRISKTPFNTDIDCEACSLPDYKDFDFVIEYKNNESYYSYFLCESMLFYKKEKSQKKVISYLMGLYHSVYQLNKNYFGIERKYK